MPSKRRTLIDLATYIKTKSGNSPNYSIFLGAGVSVTSGISSGIQLVEEWRKEIYELSSSCTFTDVRIARQYLIEKEASWYDPTNEYSSLFQKKFDLLSQRRRFVEKQVDSKLPLIGYSYLVSLFQSAYLDTVFTTNFDDLINEAFYQFSRERPTLCVHDSSIKGLSVNSSRPKIIKVHGDYLFDSIKSTLNETESLEINTREKLIEFTKKYGMLFISYAGKDRSIIDVINYLLRPDEFLGNGIYWCIRKYDEINLDLHKILKR
ncbi:SIR2 family protein [Pantoea vagans]|uniref:SIR2 family protein n=1 Tax=Pantoea vagans TaxID=470934 RepID=UPI00301B473A